MNRLAGLRTAAQASDDQIGVPAKRNATGDHGQRGIAHSVQCGRRHQRSNCEQGKVVRARREREGNQGGGQYRESGDKREQRHMLVIELGHPCRHRMKFGDVGEGESVSQIWGTFSDAGRKVRGSRGKAALTDGRD